MRIEIKRESQCYIPYVFMILYEQYKDNYLLLIKTSLN